MATRRERYRACMVLSGVGDAIGYKNQEWEYCTSGPQIHEELSALGGLGAIRASLPDWPVSDDTVMHLATAEALTSGKPNHGETLLEMAVKYKECMKDMDGRKPGPTSILGCSQLEPDRPEGYRIPFNPTGTGCGAAMRAMCIGLRYPDPDDEEDLIAVSIESGRMTHHHPTGYLGALAAALFTAYSIRRKPVESWGHDMVKLLPKALSYVESAGVAVSENKDSWGYFGDRWRWYLEQRGISDGESKPHYPTHYDVAERDEIYKTFSLDGWAGRSGHDAPMIAYDAFMAASDNWHELANRALFHAGDSDSTGTIAAAWYGAWHGLQGVPPANYEDLEYRTRLEHQGDMLYDLSGKAEEER